MQHPNNIEFDFFSGLVKNATIQEVIRKGFNATVAVNKKIKAAQTRKRLNDLSDHMLRDIGMERVDISRYGR